MRRNCNGNQNEKSKGIKDKTRRISDGSNTVEGTQREESETKDGKRETHVLKRSRKKSRPGPSVLLSY
uniref:Uncharacterized protein n=1 Tax=Oryza meridionalis TaxID=40149 RepID=A0A0E0D8X3_9ORYZ